MEEKKKELIGLFREDNKTYEDILSFEYFNYKLENLAKKIKFESSKKHLKACN